ncbi:hypothetical protein I5U42_10485 [Stenotrophomonas maltophilia]|nr:hypothetical protein [Stenotrophomonas maltophilia]
MHFPSTPVKQNWLSTVAHPIDLNEQQEDQEQDELKNCHPTKAGNEERNIQPEHSSEHTDPATATGIAAHGTHLIDKRDPILVDIENTTMRRGSW